VKQSAAPINLGMLSRGQFRQRDNFMVPVLWEFPAIAILVFLLLVQENADAATKEALNYIAPIWLSGVLGFAAVRMITAESRAIWTPLFWFRIATIAYFGFGSLVPLIANEATRIYLDSLFIIYASDMLKVNAVVAAGVAIILATNLVIEALHKQPVLPVMQGESRRPAEVLKIGLLFYTIGAMIKYLIVIPNVLSGSPLIIPGFVVQLTAFAPVGIALLTIWSLGNKRKNFVLIVALVAIEMVVGLLQLSKSETFLPAVAFAIGILTVRTSIVRLAAVGAVFWIMLYFVQPWVTHARIENATVRGAAAAEVPLSDRIAFLTSYFNDGGGRGQVQGVQESMARLSFMHAAAFVIAQYDHGFPGDSLRNVLYSFIPRFVWPDKPVVLVGWELATLATGTIGNTISAGYFAEVYWNLGWAGVLLLIPMGMAFNIASRFAVRVLRQGDWVYVPALFLNLETAITVDNFYIGFVGTSAIAVGLCILLRLSAVHLQQLGILPLPAHRP
jgi:hypothetical protein